MISQLLHVHIDYYVISATFVKI